MVRQTDRARHDPTGLTGPQNLNTNIYTYIEATASPVFIISKVLFFIIRYFFYNLSKVPFCTSLQDSSLVLWLHVGRPCIRPSVRPSVVRPSLHISFLDDNLSNHQWIFTKLGMCIIVEICFGIASGQI